MRKSWQDNYLVVSDLQIPFEHKDALKFYLYLKKHYRIPDSNILCVGDETDQYFGGLYKKNPNADHCAKTELKDSIRKLKKWYKAFPQMKLATSNHGTRWWRKAVDAEIPSQILRKYEEIIQAPPGWQWKKRWVIKAAKKNFMMEHGDDWGTKSPHTLAAIHNGISTVIGHHHSIFSKEHIKTAMQFIWAMSVGSCIDFDAYAFEYARKYKLKPVNGGGVILDGGRVPLLIPLE